MNTEESALLLTRVTDAQARTFLLIALHTGMRRGEILGLLWDDIDFQKKIIHVRHNAIIKEGQTTISDDLKTKAGKRDIEKELPDAHISAHVLRHTFYHQNI